MAWNTLARRAKEYVAQIAPTRNSDNLDGPARNTVRGYAAMGLLAAAIGGVAGTGVLADSGDPAPAAAKSEAHQQQRPAETGKKDSADKPKQVTERADGTAKARKDGSADKAAKAGKADKADPKKPAAAKQPKAAKKPAPPAPPKDPVERWIANAIDIMQKKGVPVSKSDSDEIRTVIEKESSADPRAINLWDSNAAKGTPSKGLMQTIDPTFDAYKLPGYNDIYDPVSNIIAGVRYTLARYGSFDEHPGLASMAEGGDYQGY
ncbi:MULTISPECIES: transglycosylase SLT domain-containing protein [Prauserella]|nr:MULTISPECIES: transglycosylase SLT domain-containing protein [Prauserella]